MFIMLLLFGSKCIKSSRLILEEIGKIGDNDCNDCNGGMGGGDCIGDNGAVVSLVEGTGSLY